MDGWFWDLRHAIRSLAHARSYSVIAILTLALGAGVNIALFNIVHAVLLEPLDFAEPDRLISITHRSADGFSNLTSGAHVELWREDNRVFSGLAAFGGSSYNVVSGARSERLAGARVTGNLFSVLGRTAKLGRALIPEDSGHARIVLHHSTWQQFFDGREDAIGETLSLGSRPHTVVGVMAEGFDFPNDRAKFYVPLGSLSDDGNLGVVARLRPEVDLEQATAWMTDRTEMAPHLAGEVFTTDIVLEPLLEQSARTIRTPLVSLMVAVALLLLITCLNLAGLSVARLLGLRRELAIRRALGANRWQIARRSLIESALVAFAGVLLGIAMSQFLLESLMRLLPQELPRIDQAALNVEAVGFASGMAVVCLVLIGVLPAVSVSRTSRLGRSHYEWLRAGTGASSPGRLPTVLSILQIALAVVLLSCAGLMLRSFQELTSVERGFDAEGILTFRVSWADGFFGWEPERLARHEQIASALARIPGVERVARTNFLPVHGGRGIGSSLKIGDTAESEDDMPVIPYRVVSAGYHQIMGSTLIRGRFLTEEDRKERNPSVVINESLADRFWPEWRESDLAPLGQSVAIAPSVPLTPESTIVGVVADMKDIALAEPPQPVVYVPHAVMPMWGTLHHLVETDNPEPMSLLPQIREAIRALDPTLAVSNESLLTEHVARSVAVERASTTLVAAFGVVALFLAALGLYGVLSRDVASRYRELAVRMALGARPGDLVRRVVGRALIQVGIGLGLGLLGSFAVLRLIRSLLFGVEPLDPIVVLAVPMVLLLVALTSSAMPARRAIAVEPATTLRSE